MASAISENGWDIRWLKDKLLIALISTSSSSEGGISGVLKTDHKMVVNDKNAPI